MTTEAKLDIGPPHYEQFLHPIVKENYGNWENTGLDGHIGGHYLSSLSLMYAATGEKVFSERLDYMLDWLERCQDKTGTGYIGGTPGGKETWKEIASGDIRAEAFSLNGKWVPLYNIHKLYAGLNNAYVHGGKGKAKELLVGLSDWMMGMTSNLTVEQMQEMLKSEHGGMNDVFVEVYQHTGEEKYLELAKRFSHRAILNPLLAGENNLTGLHANTQIPKVIGFKKVAQAEGMPEWSEAAAYFWSLVHDLWTVSIGGNSVREHFHPHDDFSSMVESIQGPETCNTYNMLKLTKLLFLSDPQPKYISYYERALYNHILSSQHPDAGGYVYMTPMRPRHYRVYSSSQESFWCCVGSGLENHAQYGEMIYSHTTNQLFVNLFVPSSLNWKGAGMKLLQETEFPYGHNSTLTLSLEKSRKMELMIRQPEWIDHTGMQIRINGEAQEVKADTTGYLRLSRKWKDQDRVEIRFQPKIYVESLPDHSEWYSFLYGPIVLAAKTDTSELQGLFADDSRYGHFASGPRYPVEEAPALSSGENTESLIHPLEGEGIRFKLDKVRNTEKDSLILQPFFEIHDARYMVYFPVINKVNPETSETGQEAE